MKTRMILMAVFTFSLLILVGCGNQQETNNNITEQQIATETPTITTVPMEKPTLAPTETPVSTPTPKPSPTEPPHAHFYTESTSKESTCTEAGEKTFTCDCGDTYAEQIEATGHSYGEYVYNNDATFSKDGTKTSTCANCGDEKTETAAGTKKTYTYTDLDQVMYITKSTNARSLPSKDGKKREELLETKSVKVTGKCNETGWYRITYNNKESYVDGSCLSTTRPDASTAVVWDGYTKPTKEQMSKYTFTDMNKVLYATYQKSIWTMPVGNFNPFGLADENSSQMGFLVTFYPVKVTGVCNETGWYRIDVNGHTGYLSAESGGAGDEAFQEELPKCDKPDLGYKIGSKEWHAYWDGYTYGQFYYATAQHLNLSVEEAHYFADYPFDYVIGSYATMQIKGMGSAEVKGEY